MDNIYVLKTVRLAPISASVIGSMLSHCMCTITLWR